MPLPRFRLRTLMIAVVILALAIAMPIWAMRVDQRVRALEKLAQGRHSEALRCYAYVYTNIIGGVSPAQDAYEWSLIVLRAQLEISPGKLNRIAAYRSHQARMVKLRADQIKALSTILTVGDVYWNIDYFVREADFWVAREF